MNAESVRVSLSTDQMNRLDAASAMELGFPHEFLASDFIRDLVFGGTNNSIENHLL